MSAQTLRLPGGSHIDAERLEALDRQGYTVIEALTHGGRESRTHSNPHTFVCIDGRTYWVKANVQQGLVAELICGRLATKLGVGPAAKILRVVPEALGAGGRGGHLQGVVVGSEDVADTVNGREIETVLKDGRFEPDRINARSRAAVIVFQTWLGVGDAQVLVRFTDGAIFSIDHGDAFGAVGDRSDPTVVLTTIAGIKDNVGKTQTLIMQAVQSIERLEERDLLQAVAQVPGGDPWRSPTARRIAIAEFLAYRQTRLRRVMEQWLSS